MAVPYCDCCGRDFSQGKPTCRCAFTVKCERCRACVDHCGCQNRGGRFHPAESLFQMDVDDVVEQLMAASGRPLSEMTAEDWMREPDVEFLLPIVQREHWP